LSEVWKHVPKQFRPAWKNARTMHYLSSLEVGQVLPYLRPLSNVSNDYETPQMLNMNMKLLQHFIGSLKKNLEKIPPDSTKIVK